MKESYKNILKLIPKNRKDPEKVCLLISMLDMLKIIQGVYEFRKPLGSLQSYYQIPLFGTGALRKVYLDKFCKLQVFYLGWGFWCGFV